MSPTVPDIYQISDIIDQIPSSRHLVPIVPQAIVTGVTSSNLRASWLWKREHQRTWCSARRISSSITFGSTVVRIKKAPPFSKVLGGSLVFVYRL